jgi:hypothetical protein
VLSEAVRLHRLGPLEAFQREESRKVAAAALEAAGEELVAEDQRAVEIGEVQKTDGGAQK